MLIVPAGVATATIIASLAAGALGIAASWARGPLTLAATALAAKGVAHARIARSR